MLAKFKNQVTALGIMGLIGAGSLFSGIAAQNVYAEGTVAAENVTDPREKDLSETEVSSEALNETGTESDIAGEVSEEDAFSDDLLNGSESSGNDVAEETPTSSGVTAGNEDTRSDAEEKGSKPDIKEPETKPEEKTAGVGAVKDTKFVQAVKNGWVYEKGGYKYYKNGKAYTGWHQMGKAEGEKTAHWSYFGKDGRLYTGWRQMGKAEGEKTTHWSYFGSNGWLRTGWVEFGKGTKEPDGNSTRHWSYFGSNGWLRTGWVEFGKGTKEPDGNKAKHWSYFGSNGWLRTGWVEFGKGTKEPDGNKAKHWSYFGNNGWLRTGWVEFGKGTKEPDGNSARHWSYFGDNGWMRTEWQDMGKGTANPDGNSAKHRSYFGSNGWMRIGNQTINGIKYTFDSKGWLTAQKDNPNKVFADVKIVTKANMYTLQYRHKIDYDSMYVDNVTGIKSSVYKFDFNTWKSLVERVDAEALYYPGELRRQIKINGTKIVEFTSKKSAFEIKSLTPGIYCIVNDSLDANRDVTTFQVYESGEVRYAPNYENGTWGKSGKVDSGNLIYHTVDGMSKYEVVIIEIKNSSGKELSNSSDIEVYKKNGKDLIKIDIEKASNTTEWNPQHFCGLFEYPGEYVIKCKSMPKGYKKFSDISFEIARNSKGYPYLKSINKNGNIVEPGSKYWYKNFEKGSFPEFWFIVLSLTAQTK